MTRTYAIPDLHGRFDLLCEAERAVAADAGAEPVTVVLLGDYVNKGPQSADVIARLIRGFDPRWRTVCLKGNHDAIMHDALGNPAGLQRWLANGGAATLRSYAPLSADIPAVTVVPAEHRDWLGRLPTIYVDLHRVFVHAGVDPARPLEAQLEGTLLNKRYAPDDPSGHGARHVVHGHHPFRDGPKLFAGRSDLDTLAWTTGRLVIGVFDDRVAGGPVDLIEVTGPPLRDGS